MPIYTFSKQNVQICHGKWIRLRLRLESQVSSSFIYTKHQVQKIYTDGRKARGSSGLPGRFRGENQILLTRSLCLRVPHARNSKMPTSTFKFPRFRKSKHRETKVTNRFIHKHTRIHRAGFTLTYQTQ